MLSRVSRALRYAWAAPATLVGIALALSACAGGARARVRKGVIEVEGGLLASALSLLPMRLLAITFGHVVLGVSREVLESEQAHEHAHVRQYEKWGVLFFPLYLGSSFVQIARGRDPYRDNAFEQQAVQGAAAAGHRAANSRGSAP